MRAAGFFLLTLALGGVAPPLAASAEGREMVASRYMAGMAYDPSLRTAAYGALRGRSQNALAPAYAMGPGVGFAAPMGGAVPVAAPALSGGAGGALSGGTPAALPQMDGGRDQAQEDAAVADTMGRGTPSTGNFVDDVVGAYDAGLFGAAVGLTNPAGIATRVGQTAVAAALRTAGYPELAQQVFAGPLSAITAGFSGPRSNPAFGNPSQGDLTSGNLGPGGPGSGGDLSNPGGFTDPGTAPNALSGSEASGLAGYGADNGGLGNPGFGPGGFTEGNFGGGADGGGGGLNDGGFGSDTSADSASAGSNASQEGWRKGGYTGHGEDGKVDPYEEAGPVHEGEYVLRHEATRHYGPDVLAALNSGAIPRNALLALIPPRAPMQAANHLVQRMMMRG